MKPQRKYKLLGKRMNGKVDVIMEKTSIIFACSFIEKQRAKYTKMGYLYCFAVPI
jgi:hypothetical protein